ncbi:MAG: DUF393 domain-containing protein [Candidatus Hydrogenedentes bacterium]|nr:DUF393 domain-containing protein [Candidatus Hydrogenedentota bacterium]
MRPATLIYDQECPLCRRAVAWVQANARPDTLDYLPCQSPERPGRFPSVTEAQCMEAIQLVLPDGHVYAADRALPHLFLLLRRWQWFARVLRLPVVSHLSPVAYRFVARHRHMLSILVARKERDPNCDESYEQK